MDFVEYKVVRYVNRELSSLAGVNKQNTDLKASKNILSFNTLFLYKHTGKLG